MYLMLDREISCKGHCESFSHFLYLVGYTEYMYMLLSLLRWQSTVMCLSIGTPKINNFLFVPNGKI